MVERTLRVALLRGDDAHNLYLDALLRREHDVVAVVEEPGRDQRRVLRRPAKWRDAVAAEYHHLRRRILGLDSFRRAFFVGALATDGLVAPPQADLRVHSINEVAVASLLRERAPDVCVITCVTILNPSTIDAIGVPIINIHGGHLPDYRGCHCFFFALLEGRFDAIGSTIHYVDRGIDTGDIIQVARPAIDDSDSPESLYCKAERLAARRLVEHLHALRDGRPVLSMPQQFRGRLCLRRHRRPAHDLRFAWRRRTGRLRFPTVREGERWQSGNRE